MKRFNDGGSCCPPSLTCFTQPFHKGCINHLKSIHLVIRAFTVGQDKDTLAGLDIVRLSKGPAVKQSQLTTLALSL